MNINPKTFNITTLFITYYIIQYFISPIIFTLNKLTFLNISSSSYNFTSRSIIYSILGLLCFILGNRVPIKLKVNTYSNNVSIFLLRKISILAIIFSIILFISLVNMQGGLADYMKNLNSFRTSAIIGKGVFIYPITVLIPLLILWISILVKTNNVKAVNWTLSILILIFIVLSIFIGFRGVIISFSLSCIAYYISYRNKIKLKYFISILMSLYLMFVLSQSLRQNINSKNSFSITYTDWLNLFIRSNGILVLNQTIEFKNFNKSTFNINKAILETTTIFIPKNIWLNKPIPSNRIFTKEVFNRLDTNISPTIIGYIIWLIHPYAIYPFMFILGTVFHVITSQFEINKGNNVLFNIWYLINFSSFIFMAESPQISFNQIFINSITILLIHQLSKIPGINIK